MSAKAQTLDFAAEAAAAHKHFAAGEKEFSLGVDVLISVRDRLAHGRWQPWLLEHGFAPSTVRRRIDEYHHPDKAEKRRGEQSARNEKLKTPTSERFGGNVSELYPAANGEGELNVEDEVDPENYRTAYLLRADQAMRFAAYSGPITSETVSVARRVAAAWTKLADTLERSL